MDVSKEAVCHGEYTNLHPSQVRPWKNELVLNALLCQLHNCICINQRSNCCSRNTGLQSAHTISQAGTCFQQAEIGKVGAGQASSRSCLDALMKRRFSWAGHPVAIMCDRGLHNRGVLQQYMDEHNIQVYHVPLESPESLGRVERHGGLLKALFRRVCTEVGACRWARDRECPHFYHGSANSSRALKPNVNGACDHSAIQQYTYHRSNSQWCFFYVC